MGTFQRSVALVKASWHVLRQDKELLALPVISSVAAVALAAPFVVGAVVGFAADGGGTTTAADGTASESLGAGGLVGVVLLLLAYLVGAYVTVFFQSALVLAANERMSGGNPTLGSALGAAWANKGRVLGWAMVSATVSIVLQSLQERAGFVGRLVVGALGLAWTLVTLLVLPVLVIEQVGLKESFTRSAEAFRRTWGETVVANGGIGLVSFLAGLAVVLLSLPFLLLGGSAGGAAGSVGIVLGVAVLVVGLLAVAAFSAALSGVFRTALYRYAVLGEEYGGFTHEQIAGAFRPKG